MKRYSYRKNNIFSILVAGSMILIIVLIAFIALDNLLQEDGAAESIEFYGLMRERTGDGSYPKEIIGNKIRTSIFNDSPVIKVSAQTATENPSQSEAGNPIASEPSVIGNPQDYLPPNINYARVPSVANVYASIEAIENQEPFTTHGGPSTWVNAGESVIVGNQRYYHVGWGWDSSGWISEADLSFTPILSNLRGVELSDYPNERLAMVYVSVLNVRSEPGIIDPETRVGQVHKYDLVSVQEERFIDGALWYRIGSGQWVHEGYVRNLTPGSRPSGVGSNEKWIEINLTEQTIFAHEGDTPIYATLTSTGRPGRETITGLYRPWIQFQSSPMRGHRFGLQYDYANVPWIVYFESAYAYHGVYWHDNYGTVQSAGCVNLSPYDANWFFHWGEPGPEQQPTAANPGTWVYSHY